MLDFNYLLRGLKIIMLPGLKRYVIVPAIISAIIFIGFYWVAFTQFETFMNSMAMQFELPGWLDWLNTLIDWLLWPLFFLTFFVLVFYGYTIVANLVGAPFNGLLAEAVARKLDSSLDFPDAEPLIKDIPKSLFNEFRKLFYYLVRALPLLLLMLFPLTSAPASLIWLLFSAWFLALEYIAYPLENQKMNFRQQRSVLGQHRLSAMSFGGGVMLMLLIPILNLAVMPAAVAGATIYWHEKLRASQALQKTA